MPSSHIFFLWENDLCIFRFVFFMFPIINYNYEYFNPPSIDLDYEDNRRLFCLHKIFSRNFVKILLLVDNVLCKVLSAKKRKLKLDLPF